jgi:sulfide:quinone oxidoreductase
VVLRGGTGGTLVANRLRRRYPPGEIEVTVVDRDDRHLYQPGLLFVPFGLTHPADIVRPRARQLHRDIGFRESDIDHVDIDANQVHLPLSAKKG